MSKITIQVNEKLSGPWDHVATGPGTKAMKKLRRVMRKANQKLNTLTRKLERERKRQREAYEWAALDY